ncbi:MAG: NADH-quinone oxidoreductase subunit N [Deltaproteobacteria bacterium RIFOXYD12_FULL_57_12]|nr:MAG: NADH-quinone oxidoreductase subunit N [Deltaproteobacteria bacterium RIFOXYD12_FULL_57_12]
MKIALFLPELFLLCSCLVLFLLSLGRPGARQVWGITTILAIINTVLCVVSLGAEGELFYQAYRIDLFSQIFKLLILLGLSLLLLGSRDLKGIKEDIRPEYYLFLLLSVLGLVMLVSCVELLSILIALELSSFSLYLLVPMRDDHGGIRVQMEAGIKYILFGVVATGVMLFGMSYLFGLTGTTYLTALVPGIAKVAATPAAVVGLVMVMGGFFFKLGVFPFHFWMPDVYQGASNETTTFIASIPKLGAVALLIRIAHLAAPAGEKIAVVLMVLSVCSMFYGNLIALVQKDVKRMLGFSGIAHAGYILLGIVTLKDTGYAYAIYYICGYMVMNLACFLVISKVSVAGENLLLSDLAGLHRRAPLLALTLAVGMFALAGIPPFVGFMGKFMLLTNALKNGYLYLVILAALNTAISIYYYLSVVRISFCSDPEERGAVTIDGTTILVSVALMAIIIVLGVAPAGFIEIATTAVRGIM